MAEHRAVWGIDIGQAGLKAIKLRYAEAADQVLAVAFDYIPHAKILSQPDAIPEELIPQAIEQFLSRNDIQGDLVAISVPGQTALSRFIQLPPVEASKVAEIVKYEARQQIPFALEDVIWDYQPISGGVEESGYMLEAEVGLFAMKRDQIMQHLRPYTDAKIEVELIQIAPLGLYNFLCYDHLGISPGDEPEESDEHTIMIDMGADNTTLLVSNGVKIWIRNVPIGGNHFTRALTKEMKLTFAKAEHLKCNATKSPDPRAVFQALRPVFNDYVSEIQRSIGYFSSVNRDAKITKVLGLGNGFKLAGLQKFLQQNLQYDVERVDHFQALVGDRVLNSPIFQDNLLSFAVPYGLALQTLQLTKIRTTLLPPEIATARKIRRKKPWAVVTAASLLLGLATSTVGYSKVASSVSIDRFGEAESRLEEVKGKVSGFASAYAAEEGKITGFEEQGLKLVENLETREYWVELYRALNQCLPRDTGDALDVTEITKMNRIKLPSITAVREDDLSEWFNKLRPAAKDRMLAQDKETAPEGEGYLFTLEGIHYHDEPKNPTAGQGVLYVVNTLLKNLQSWTVQQPGTPEVSVRQLGITHATVIRSSKNLIRFYPGGKNRSQQFAGTGGQPPGFAGAPAAAAAAGDPLAGGTGRRPGLNAKILLNTDADDGKPKFLEIPQTTFTLQFIWKPTSVSERLPQMPGSE